MTASKTKAQDTLSDTRRAYAAPYLSVIDTNQTQTGAIGALSDGTNTSTASVAGGGGGGGS